MESKPDDLFGVAAVSAKKEPVIRSINRLIYRTSLLTYLANERRFHEEIVIQQVLTTPLSSPLFTDSSRAEGLSAQRPKYFLTSSTGNCISGASPGSDTTSVMTFIGFPVIVIVPR
jgi:hypothetical protein